MPEPPQGPVAHRVRAVVEQHPGIHFRELGRLAAVHSTGQLRHHIDRLARRGAIVEVADGRYRRYMPAGYEPGLQTSMARLSRPVPRRIAMQLLGGARTRTAIRRALGCADSTLGYHLARLVRQGDLVQHRAGSACWYALTEPEVVRRVLLAQGTTPPEPGPAAAPFATVVSPAPLGPGILPDLPATFLPIVVEPYVLPARREPDAQARAPETVPEPGQPAPPPGEASGA